MTNSHLRMSSFAVFTSSTDATFGKSLTMLQPSTLMVKHKCQQERHVCLYPRILNQSSQLTSLHHPSSFDHAHAFDAVAPHTLAQSLVEPCQSWLHRRVRIDYICFWTCVKSETAQSTSLAPHLQIWHGIYDLMPLWKETRRASRREFGLCSS